MSSIYKDYKVLNSPVSFLGKKVSQVPLLSYSGEGHPLILDMFSLSPQKLWWFPPPMKNTGMNTEFWETFILKQQ